MLWLAEGDGAAVNVRPLSNRSAVSGFSAGLLIADLFPSVDDFAFDPLLYGDVRHRYRGRSAVPAPQGRLKPDNIARTDFMHRSALTLQPPKAA